MLSSDEAALRLGIKVTTLYAYVSRGMVQSHPNPTERGSLFALSDIESLAVRGRGGRQTQSRLATVTTGITQLSEARGPIYRGRAATDLAATMTFEEAAAHLWQTEAAGDWTAPPIGTCTLTNTSDRLRWVLVMCGALDPIRADPRPDALIRSARRVIAALIGATGPAPPDDDTSKPASDRLAHRLGGREPTSSGPAINAALVLMADHELATSTMAVRIAASVRADLYDALLAGLATLAGPLHGDAGHHAYELLSVAERDGPARALNESLRALGHLPGFGHPVYHHGDPRYDALMTRVGPLLGDERRGVLSETVQLAATHAIPPPNVDLALAALSWGTGMPPDAGRTLFSIARMVGWTSHYIEELAERPLRYRARAIYSSGEAHRPGSRPRSGGQPQSPSATMER
jgi:citrate synthase